MNQKQQQAVSDLIDAYNEREQARVRYANAARDYSAAINAVTPALDLPEMFAVIRGNTVYTVEIDCMDGHHEVYSAPLLATAEVSVEEGFGDDNQATRHINVEWRQE